MILKKKIQTSNYKNTVQESIPPQDDLLARDCGDFLPIYWPEKSTRQTSYGKIGTRQWVCTQVITITSSVFSGFNNDDKLR